MLKRIRNLLLLGGLICCLTFSFAIFAQVVDPCWYGCPKEGCSQCGNQGGPVSMMESGDQKKSMSTAPEACKKACQKNERHRRGDCHSFYPVDSETDKHQMCMKKSKNLFQKCKSAC
jgi:hypothetical protein